MAQPGQAPAAPQQAPRGRQAQGQQAAAPQQQAQPVRPEERCSIDGSIFNLTTGEPVRKAAVSLRRAGGGGPGGMSYSATTDAAGHYTIADIEPGRYRLSVEKGGFVDQQYGAKKPGDGGSTLALEKSQKLRDVTIKMTPHGVVAGRVLDDDGDPVVSASVQVLQRTYVRGRKQYQPVDNASTNDLGEFRIYGLPPGRYVLSAFYRRGFRNQPVQDAEQETYAATYYPGGSSPEMAAPVDVQPGSQYRGLDIRLRKTRAVRITGRVVGSVTTDRGRGGTNIALVPKDGGANFGPRAMAQPYNALGDFMLSNVAPGSYTLIATRFENNQVLSARLPLEVGNSPVEGLVLSPQPGAQLQGRVKFEGTTAPDIKNLRVTLASKSGGGGGPMFGPGGGQQSGGLKEDNTFTLANVTQEAYDVRVNGVPDGGYIKAIKLGDADVTDTGLDFTSAVVPAELTVVINMAAGQVEGVVQNDKPEPVSGATVVLVPEGTRRQIDRYYVQASTDDTGHFTLKNVTPGDYRVYSFDNVEGSAYMDPDWLKPFESKGEKVTIKENGRESVQLKVVLTQGA